MAMVRPAFSGPSQIGIKYYGLVTLPWREVVLYSPHGKVTGPQLFYSDLGKSGKRRFTSLWDNFLAHYYDLDT